MTHSSAGDFDFEFGSWTVKHRRLKERLKGCADWEEFSGSSETRPILGGNGNLEDNVINLPSGSYRAIALRTFDPASRKWAIWWIDGRAPHALDVPVIGDFTDGTGTFVANDTLDGLPVQVRFVWSRITAESAWWEQAFSADGGRNWETNWTMAFSRAASRPIAATGGSASAAGGQP